MVGGNVNGTTILENIIWNFLKKLKLELSYNTATLLGILVKEYKSLNIISDLLSHL